MTIKFEEPDYSIDKAKVTINATAFVNGYATGFKFKKYENMIRLEVDPDPKGKEVYKFFKNKIFKGNPPPSTHTDSVLGVVADWLITTEMLNNVFNRARIHLSPKWEEAFRAEKQRR